MTDEELAAFDAKWRSKAKIPQIITAPLPVLDAAGEEWVRLLGTKVTAPATQVLMAIIPGEGQHVDQLRTNLLYLLAREMDAEGVISGEISFDAFRAVFLKHGSPTGLQPQIEALTPPGDAVNPTVAWFNAGICFGVNQQLFAERWRNASADSWALADGRQPGTLLFFTKGREEDRGMDRCRRITIDPTAFETRMAVEMEPGNITYVSDIPHLLSEFGLHRNAGVECTEAPRPPDTPFQFGPGLDGFEDNGDIWWGYPFPSEARIT
jgi:hypothetical protein